MNQINQEAVVGMRGRLRAALVAGGLVTAMASGLALVPVVSADTTPTPAPIKGRQIHGTVASVNASASTFVVNTEQHGAVTVQFVPPVQHGKAGEHGQAGEHGKAKSHLAASIAGLKAGEKVVVQGRYNATSKTFVARQVHVLAASKVSHAVGTVASFTAGSTAGTGTLVVTLSDGSTQTFQVNAETELRPAGKTLANLTAGTKVTVVGKDGVAKGIVFQA